MQHILAVLGALIAMGGLSYPEMKRSKRQPVSALACLVCVAAFALGTGIMVGVWPAVIRG